MWKLNTGYIPIYLSARTCCVKSIDDFPIEFSMNFLFHYLDLHLVVFPTNVSGQHIPEGIPKETRVVITTSWHSCLVSMDSFSPCSLVLVYCSPSSCKSFHKAQHDTKERFKVFTTHPSKMRGGSFSWCAKFRSLYLHIWIYLKNLPIHIYNFACNQYIYTSSFSSITKLDYMSHLIKEGYLT